MDGRYRPAERLSKPTRVPRALGGLITAAVAAMAAACSPLGVFSTLAPKDPAKVVGQGVAYGPDPRQKLDIYAPRVRIAAAPVVVFFYGGSWNSGRRQDYAWVGKALAAQGFVAVVADYRLYPKVRYPAFLEDGALAARWVADNAGGVGGDPQRMAFVGHSAGAYNAVMLGLDPRYLKAAGVDPQRVRAIAGLSGPYDFLPLDGDITTRTFADAADLPATQPGVYVRADAPPAFLATGADDTMVYPRNTQRLAAALRAKGAVVEEKTYPNLGHIRMVLALSRPLRGEAPVLADLSRFLHEQMTAAPK